MKEINDILPIGIIYEKEMVMQELKPLEAPKYTYIMIKQTKN